LLAEKLGIEVRRVGSGKRRKFSQGERLLSAWMEENAFVCWAECDEPWIVEGRLITTLSLPFSRLFARKRQIGRESCPL
jgi:hypothetical protein